MTEPSTAEAEETSPVVSAGYVATRHRDLALLDATVDLPAPRADGDYRVASGRRGWAAEHIPGSRHVDLTAELTDPSRAYHFAHLPSAELAARVQRWGVTAGSRVVVYDQGGTLWAARLWWELRAIGVPVQVLDGGLPAWKAAGLRTETGDDAADPPPADRAVPVRPLSAAWADRNDVLNTLAGRAPATLVCTLGDDVYSGRAATRYVRRGHIPGSVNLPARGLLDEHGLLLGRHDLEAAIRSAIPDPGDRLILYCGGGISAALLALALTVVGIGDFAIYDGSLEEWTADPALPVEVTA